MIRGRGRGDGEVSIKVERVVRNQEQEEGSVYEDEVVYVTERRKRGRPKRPVPVVTPPPPKALPQHQQRRNEALPQHQQRRNEALPQHQQRRNDAIYVSAARGRPQYVIPTQKPVQHSLVTPAPALQRATPLLTTARQVSLCAPHCPRAVRCVVASVSSMSQAIVHVTKPAINPGLQRKGGETKIAWPADLQELVEGWDSLPERRLSDVVKWFDKDLSRDNQPKIVQEIQEMWSSMPETLEEKVNLALEWLDIVDQQKSHAQSGSAAVGNVATIHNQSNSSNGLPTTKDISLLNALDLVPENSVKVLVEAQPNSIQDCGGRWSSMTDI